MSADHRIHPELQRKLRLSTALHPQPVAIASGRVLRSRSPQERLDATLRAGEVLARYLAALSLGSFAARGTGHSTPLPSPKLGKGWSFGDFLTVAQTAGKSADHPLAVDFAQGFTAKRGEGPADAALVRLLTLRNQLGHQLDTLTDTRAAGLLASQSPKDGRPLESLVEALDGLDDLLSRPLLVVEAQTLEDEEGTVAHVLLLLGESADPEPRRVLIHGRFSRKRGLYVVAPEVVLRLHPFLVWEPTPALYSHELYIFDQVTEKAAHYKPLRGAPLPLQGAERDQLENLLQGGRQPAEQVAAAEGTLFDHWKDEYRHRQEVLDRKDDSIPWNRLEPDTVRWYAQRLDPGSEPDAARALVQERLLHGRHQLREEEIRQLVLLLGRREHVAALLRRQLLDMRLGDTSQGRWRERVESDENVLASLRIAVELLHRHVGSAGVTLDGLRATTGSADYVAIREALVNLFIHQDYDDASSAAQIEIRPEATVFFNPGSSLIGLPELLEGGISQARNPLIARALRLIGFAELGGSGLRELQRVWRGARRRPPEIRTKGNSFRLLLDWRPIPEVIDPTWHQRIGVRISLEEATILNLAADRKGVSPTEAALATGLDIPAAREALQRLKTQVLVEEVEGRSLLTPHLCELFAEAKNAASPDPLTDGGNSESCT